MNTLIMNRAILQVKALLAPMGDICGICYKNKAEFGPDAAIEVMGIETAVGLCVCRTCFDNIRIALGEISQEY
ncbi:hypothetical protein JCM14469_17690 [Desulfatiferula olefinivorans]